MTDTTLPQTGDFTPGDSSALRFPVGMINAAWLRSITKFSSFEDKTQEGASND